MKCKVEKKKKEKRNIPGAKVALCHKLIQSFWHDNNYCQDNSAPKNILNSAKYFVLLPIMAHRIYSLLKGISIQIHSFKM